MECTQDVQKTLCISFERLIYMFNLRPGPRENCLMQQIILCYSLYLVKNLIPLTLVTAVALKRVVMVSD